MCVRVETCWSERSLEPSDVPSRLVPSRPVTSRPVTSRPDRLPDAEVSSRTGAPVTAPVAAVCSGHAALRSEAGAEQEMGPVIWEAGVTVAVLRWLADDL